MPKVSVIIPVYNIEKYISKCIETVANQTYKNCEIILVDDGSTDNSGEICDKYTQKYSNIKCYHKKNGGASSARNLGIEKSNGEYVIFVDGDDYISSEDMLEKLVPYLKYDVVQYKMIYFYEKKNKSVLLNDLEIYHDENIMEQLKNKTINGELSISPCDKAVRKSVLIDNNLFFDEKLISEDIDWSLKLYLCASSMYTINLDFYVYRQQREGSTTNKCTSKSIKSLFYVINKWVNYNYDNGNTKNIYYNYIAYQYVLLLTVINRKNCSRKLKKDIYKLNYLMKYHDNYKVNMAYRLFNIFGMKLGRHILKKYLCLKNKGILKI